MLFLSACCFSSEQTFFSSSEGARPFGDGAPFTWRDTDGETRQVAFAWSRDGTYTLAERAETDDQPMRGLLFVPIEATPEDDYVVQWRIRPEDDEGVVYAYMWRTAQGYRVFTDPRGFSDSGDAPEEITQYCEPRAYGECVFKQRGALLAFYQAMVYPAFVQGGASPTRAVDLIAEPLP